MIALARDIIERASEYLGPEQTRHKCRALRLARTAASDTGLPCKSVNGCLWRVTAPIYKGFIVKLDMLAYDHFVMFVAFAGVTAERDFIGRQLAITLLEFNQRLLYGSYRLDENKKGMRSVVLGYACDTRHCEDAHVPAAAREMISEMQRSLVELYARDLIILPDYRSTTQS